MSHKVGDVVTYQLGDIQVNALVVQSNPQPDGEHLVVAYLDPRLASNSMAGSLVDKAIAKAFAVPLSEGKTYGWKDLESPTYTKSLSDEALDHLMPYLTDLSMTVAKIAPHMEISPDGTLISAKTLLESYSRVVPAPVQPKNPASVEDVLAAQKAGKLIIEGVPSAADLDAHAAEEKAKQATAAIDEAQGEIQPGDPESPHAIEGGTFGAYQPEGGTYPVGKAAVAADPTQGADSAEVSSAISAPVAGPDTSAAAPSSAQPEASTSSPEPSLQPSEMASTLAPTTTAATESEPHETLKEKIHEELEKVEESVGEALGTAIDNRS